MPIDIVNYMYCPRYIYYQYVLEIPQYEEKNFLLLEGREMHEKKLIRNKEYLRKRIGVVKKNISPYLANDKLRGRPDEVLELSDGTMAPLDYKFSKFEGRIYKPIIYQLISYAVLIEDIYQKEVNRGFIVFVRSSNHLEELEIRKEDKSMINKAIDGVLEIIEKEIYPEVTAIKKKCVNCTYKNICPR